MNTQIWRLIGMTLLFLTAASADVQLITTGLFTASQASAWSVTTFTGASLAVPTTAGSFDVVLGTLTHSPTTIGASSSGSGPVDFTLTLAVQDSTSGSSSNTIQYQVSGPTSFYWGGYDYFAASTAVIPFSYTTKEGSGSFNLQLRGISNPNFPGFVRVNPNGSSAIGGRITNATFTPAPPVSVPDAGPFGLMTSLVFAVILAVHYKAQRKRAIWSAPRAHR